MALIGAKFILKYNFLPSKIQYSPYLFSKRFQSRMESIVRFFSMNFSIKEVKRRVLWLDNLKAQKLEVIVREEELK